MLFDDRDRTASEWEVLVQYDPTTQLYNVVRRQDNRVTRTSEVRDVTTAEAQFDEPFRASLHPDRSGRYYYNLIVDVQTLTESDLDALQQWLRGPTAPGREQSASRRSGSGIGQLFSRVLGGGRTQRVSRTRSRRVHGIREHRQNADRVQRWTAREAAVRVRFSDALAPWIDARCVRDARAARDGGALRCRRTS